MADAEAVPVKPTQQAPRIALALASGAPAGAVYEIGALRALDEALEGVDLNHLFIYVGVSAGAFLAANLANDITPAQMCRAIVKAEPGEHPFVPETFLTPDVAEFARSGRALPGLLGGALWDYFRHFRGRSLLGSLMRLSEALPVGVFNNEPIRVYLERIYNIKGRTDDFRKLGKRLVVVASDLDSGLPVRFGEPGMDQVPISRAVEASSALPGLYSPVEIGGRHYVDGVLHKTVHASVALEAGADLVVCINPLVPINTAHAVEAGFLRHGNLRERGLPAVLAQTFRTIIRSRLEVGMAAYRNKFGGADVVLIEPEPDDYEMFFTNIFGFAGRRAVCEHAYEATRRFLLARHDSMAPIFARHGVTLRRDVLADRRNLWEGVGLPADAPAPAKAPRKPSSHADVRQLDEALERLDRLLNTAAAAREPGLGNDVEAVETGLGQATQA